MVRVIVFLLLIALAAAGASWIAEQSGDVSMTWGSWRIQATLPVFALALGVLLVTALVLWSAIRGLIRAPARMRKASHERRRARGRHAITQGLLAIGHGDAATARQHAQTARKLASHDPLSLLLHAQTAQLEGNREEARAAFRAMADRSDTRLLGLRGLFIEAQRADDMAGAILIADEALKSSPASAWASEAVLAFRCAQGDWAGAMAILDGNQSAGLIDKPTWRRHRAVLLTARALETEKGDRDLARESVREAVKLAPTLVPAAVLAARFESESQQVRRAMRLLEAAWAAEPHPDLAMAYAHVRPGDSAQQRLARAEALAAKAPGHIEGVIAVGRAALEASEFNRARAVLAPHLDDPTQRVAMLMAEIEHSETGDVGRAREWTLRAVRARLDPAWIADGHVSDRWRPFSPVSGRIDAFRWQTPPASLALDRSTIIDSEAFTQVMLAAPKTPALTQSSDGPAEPQEPSSAAAGTPMVQDNSPVVPPKPAETASEPQPSAIITAPPPATAPEPEEAAAPAAQPQPQADAAPASGATRPRSETPKPVAPVVPIVRAPDDPGIQEENQPPDEFVERIGTSKPVTGWRLFFR